MASADRQEIVLPENEKLTFQVKWMGLPVGEIVASVKGKREFGARRAYVLEIRARTNAFASKFKRVDDLFVSYLDTEDLCVLRQEVHRKDGGFKKDARTDFDHAAAKAYFHDLRDDSKFDFGIPPGVLDLVSVCYYLQLCPFVEGGSFEYDIVNNERVRRFFCLIADKVPFHLAAWEGKEARVVYPFASLSRGKVLKGRVRAYYSPDRRRYPLHAVVRGLLFTEISITLIRRDSD